MKAADAEKTSLFSSVRIEGRICLFTNNGQLYTVKVQDLPLWQIQGIKGIPIDNVSNFNSSQEELLLVTSQSELNLYRVIFHYEDGDDKGGGRRGEFDVCQTHGRRF